MPLERVIYHPMQHPMAGVFSPSVGGSSVPANAVTDTGAVVTDGGATVTSS